MILENAFIRLLIPLLKIVEKEDIENFFKELTTDYHKRAKVRVPDTCHGGSGFWSRTPTASLPIEAAFDVNFISLDMSRMHVIVKLV